MYLIVVDGSAVHVGETIDLYKRFSSHGYGAIQRRNRYVGGQSTNCKVNNKINVAARAGSSMRLYVHYTDEHKRIESQIRAATKLPWNSI